MGLQRRRLEYLSVFSLYGKTTGFAANYLTLFTGKVREEITPSLLYVKPLVDRVKPVMPTAHTCMRGKISSGEPYIITAGNEECAS